METRTPSRVEDLRPKSFCDFIGQENAVDQILYRLKASLRRDTAFPHTLLTGPRGLGKTTLAQIISNERGVNIVDHIATQISKPSDLISILKQLKKNDILFLDEIHRLRGVAAEAFYRLMEDFYFHQVFKFKDRDLGEQEFILSGNVLPFTIIGATTISGALPAPFRDRFSIQIELDFYSDEVLQKILFDNSQKLGFNLHTDACEILVQRSRRTTRVANRWLQACIDYVEGEERTDIYTDDVVNVLYYEQIDRFGLRKIDRTYLQILASSRKNVPLSTIIAKMGYDDPESITGDVEPYMHQMGYVDISSGGRQITLEGESVLSAEDPFDLEFVGAV